MRKFRSHPTPNPNSLKITGKGGVFIESGLLSFSTPLEAEEHPLGSALFGIPGVDNLLVLPDFLTITKSTEVNWRKLWPEIERTLIRYYSS